VRSLLERLLSLFLPARGKRRAEAVPTQPELAPARSLTVTTRTVFPVIDADALPLVRPYLLRHEQEQERQRQAERRIALALATMGIDFPECAA
jgi:hypothetical protein